MDHPRAIVGSLLLTTLFYTGVVVALHLTVPPAAFKDENLVMIAPLSVIVTDEGVPLLTNYVLPITALIAIFTTMLVRMTGSARILRALAERGIFPKAFAATNDYTNAPYVALVVVAISASSVVID